MKKYLTLYCLIAQILVSNVVGFFLAMFIHDGYPTEPVSGIWIIFASSISTLIPFSIIFCVVIYFLPKDIDISRIDKKYKIFIFVSIFSILFWLGGMWLNLFS